MVDVFVSYVRDDEKKVSKIVERLEENGVRNVWWDRLLKPGENFSLVIEEKIEESQNVLVAWSDRSRASLYVRGEALDALERGKLVQVVIDRSRLPVPFNALQAVYLHDWNGEKEHQKWSELVTVIDKRNHGDVGPNDGEGRTSSRALSDREISSVGISGIQKTALWLMPLLLCTLVVFGVGLMLDMVPTFGIAKQTIFLTMGGGVVIILGVLISMLINTLLFNPRTEAKLMSAIERHENVDRFVASARRLIIIQIIVAIIALVAAVAATVLIWRAFVEQGEAAQATLAAETAKEEASAAKKQADEAVQQSQREQRRIATMRPILQATTWQEYASAADALEETARQIPDEDVYALLASANYRGADADNPERVGRLVKATALLLEATRLNKQRVEATDETDAFTSQDKHNAELYVEYIGVQCSALKSSPSRSADILNSLQLLAAPDDVIETIRTENLLRDTPIIQRECDRSIIQSIETLYGIEPVRSVAVANLEDFEIEKVFMHISDERDRSLAIEISEDLELGSDVAVPGTERIVSDASAYKASVRYYHQEQATQAAAIQNAVLSSANANDANWSASDIPLIKLNLKDLPRDRLEVWLPSRSSLKTSRRAKFDISESVNVYYYQRGADGLSVLNTLETLLQESNLVVDSSEPGLTAVNAILCSENAPPETLESAKQLALSLLDAGVAIKQVAASDAPIADTGIEIRYAVSADALPVLTSDQINALQTCPRNL